MVPSSFRTPLLFWAIRLVSQTGQGIFIAALFLIAGLHTGEAVNSGAIIVAMSAAAIVFALPSGSFVDRIGPAPAFLIGAVLRFGAILSALLVIDVGHYAWVIAFAYSSVSQVFSPAELSLVRAVSPARPAVTHAALVVLQHSGQIAGAFVLGPILYMVGGERMMILGASTAYLLVIPAIAILRSRLREGEAEFRVPTRDAFAFMKTFRFLAREPRAAHAIGLLAFTEMAMKAGALSVPLYLHKDLHLTSLQMGSLAFPALIGVALGLVWSGRMLRDHHVPRAMQVALGIAVGSLLILACLGSWFGALLQFSGIPLGRSDISFITALPLALFVGVSLSVAIIGGRMMISATAQKGLQARVFATQALCTDLLVILPVLLAGLGTELVGARVTILGISAAGLTTFILLEKLLRRTRHPSALTTAPAGFAGAGKA